MNFPVDGQHLYKFTSKGILGLNIKFGPDFRPLRQARGADTLFFRQGRIYRCVSRKIRDVSRAVATLICHFFRHCLWLQPYHVIFCSVLFCFLYDFPSPNFNLLRNRDIEITFQESSSSEWKLQIRILSLLISHPEFPPLLSAEHNFS